MSIKDDIKFAFQKQNNAHIQFLLVNLGVFLLINTLRILSSIGQNPVFYSISNFIFSIPPTLENFSSRPWTIITYAFAHEGLGHIFWNMAFLYFIGRVLLDFIGSRRFINIYMLGGIAGAVLYLLCYNTIPFYLERLPAGMIGASASVNAIAVAAATLAPNFGFRLLFIGEIRLKYIALFFVITSFISVDGGNAGGNIAHLGGAGLGYLFITMLQKGTDLGKPLNLIYNFIGGLFNPSKKVKITYRKESKKQSPSTSSTKKEATSQAEIDAILDKIAESGYESLSKIEKDKLFNASKE